MNLVKPLIISGLVSAMVLGVGTPNAGQSTIAYAAEKIEQKQVQKTGLVLNQEELKNVETELQKYNVDEKTINKLVKKLEKQVPLDSMILDDSDAVSVTKIENATGYEAVHTFADGSISVVGVEELEKIADGGFTTMGTGISGGSCSGGTGYLNCSNKKVYYSNPGVWEISFRANYTYVYGGYDKITWANNESIWMVGGTNGDPSMRIIRGTETAFKKAEARFSTYLYLGGAYGTQTRSVSLILGGDSASARGNTYY
ncbi:hypothetical protein [Bacillus sp. V33-4]|uniref:hypothetical protein n=1 Tax=Bacillus sp. V33-4 TaxID=2054169 RepID=UPI000C7763AB|nr:hypothetical protein [Bacillus sp. V33-4]PLR85835.1 hypothetical protein CVD23_07840 [Bacillus sp. V33-4]